MDWKTQISKTLTDGVVSQSLVENVIKICSDEIEAVKQENVEVSSTTFN